MRLTRDGVCSLCVRAASRQDAGHYTCCATNVVGRDTCSAELYIEGEGAIDETSYVSSEALRKIIGYRGSFISLFVGPLSVHQSILLFINWLFYSFIIPFRSLSSNHSSVHHPPISRPSAFSQTYSQLSISKASPTEKYYAMPASSLPCI